MKKKPKPYHLLFYIEDSETKIKRFDSTEKMGKFMDDFMKKYPDYTHMYSGNWLEYSITDINGRIDFYTDGLEVE